MSEAASGEAQSVETWSGKDRGDENFPVGSLLIRADLREHVHAFYAFARNADDIADHESLAPAEKLARLDVMQDVLGGARETGSPSALRLRASLYQTGVSDIHARELLVAFRRDAVKQRTESWAELLDYCRYSAMPVGRHVLDLHGEDRAIWPASDALCTSLQVLNHLQDGQKDLRALDRCYLPRDMLAARGATVEDLLGVAETPGLRCVFSALLDQCDVLNDTAKALPRGVRDRRWRVETAVIAGLARRLTRRLRQADPVAGRVRLTKPDAVKALLGAMRYLIR